MQLIEILYSDIGKWKNMGTFLKHFALPFLIKYKPLISKESRTFSNFFADPAKYSRNLSVKSYLAIWFYRISTKIGEFLFVYI